jgi:hypothetical protein
MTTISQDNPRIKPEAGHVTTSLASRVTRSHTNPLIRVEQLKRQFVSTQLTQLRTQIYASMRQAGATHVYALAEVDRALADVARAVDVASTDARTAVAEAELAKHGKAWVAQIGRVQL